MRDFSTAEIDAHARLHDSSYKYNFYVEPQANVQNWSNGTTTAPTSNIYPLVEPLEFYTN